MATDSKVEPKQLPNLSAMSQQIANDNHSVGAFVESVVDFVDEISDATARSDWDEVRKLAEYIAMSGLMFGMPALSESAENVCNSIDQSNGENEIKRRVIRLLGACGRIRLSDTTSGINS